MFMRRRPLLRAAAVGGSAYLAGKKMGGRAGQQRPAQAGQDEPVAGPGQQAAAQAPDPGAQPSPMPDQLSQLTALHQQGALTDAEFAAAKARLLG